MNQIILIIIFYIISIYIQYIIYKKTLNDVNNSYQILNDKIAYNISDENNIINFMNSELATRLEKLKNMTYDNWIEYNANNIFYNFNDKKYYCVIWRNIPTTQFFTLDVYPDKTYINGTWKDMVDRINSNFIYAKKFKPDELLIPKMYQNNKIPYGKFHYYWVDPLYDNKLVRRIGILKNFDDGKGNKGIILTGYNVENVDQNNYFNYYNVNKKFVIIFNIGILISTIIIYNINKDNKYAVIKSIIFMICLQTYSLLFNITGEEDGSYEAEVDKNKNINDGILGISFLIAANIFIMSKLDNDTKHRKNFIESIFLFSLVLLCLLASSFKVSSYSYLEEQVKNRLRKQYFINACIVINMYIIVNFALYNFGFLY
jgi:hypothetical protein